MNHVPVLIAGGGPVGMTLARTLAALGIRCQLVERNASTTRHPKMDITNGRSMELFRRLGLADRLRAAAVPEENCFDVSWITSLARDRGGRELHRFRYPCVAEKRAEILACNDGTQAREPAMRVSQVKIEPVLQAAIVGDPRVDARWGVALEDFTQDADGVTATLRTVETGETGETEQVRCDFLAGCDGGSSIVRDRLGIGLEGRAAVAHRYMIHFRSDARDLLQAFGIAWHYQTARGTLIAQDDRDTWTLQTRPPPGTDVDRLDPHAVLDAWAGRPFEREVLVDNPWFTHLLLAERYAGGRVFLAGDAAHQYIPTGGYGMNTGIADAVDLGWKLAATLRGFAGPGLLRSYEADRRPVGLRNRQASERHTDVRIRIGELYERIADPQALGREIAALGNAENESWGIELGYRYDGVEGDPVRYEPTTAPGARLPSTFLRDGSALYDRLGPWFTLLVFGGADPSPLIDAAPAPLDTVIVDDPAVAPFYEARLVLVRPDTHVAWRGNGCADGRAVWRAVLQ
ncbi:FAD-dependent monooxygenase [Reyranella sp.]|uniref:FAD-dependent monooxygenase n=1 Tax=Reyranella sp. TaxID=1929291 RepID=UPI003BAD52E5